VNPAQLGFGFHHIGIACSDLDADERAFAALGYARERDECVDTIQSVRARFLVGPGPRIELVCDLDPGGHVSELAKRGVKMYHVAYEVDDLDEAERRLAQHGAKLIVGRAPGAAFGMRIICFYALPNMTLIELISRA
jgi:methylmalonyl-CoA/ethylmalonyl-CoA epimerase